jgi:phosphoglycerol transferase MdoB-like AlkP superfamily enzyme
MVQEVQKKQGKVWLGCGLVALAVMLLAAGVLFRATLRQLPWQQSVPALLAFWALAWSGLYALCSLPRLVREDLPRAAAVALCGLQVLRWMGAYYTKEMSDSALGLFGLLCEYSIMGRGIFLLVVSLLMPRLYRFNEEQLRLPWLERALRLIEWAALTLMGVEFAGFSNALRQMDNWKILLNFALLLLLCLAWYGLIGRLYLAVCLWSVVVGVGAVANYYVWQFRGFPIMASDLLALGTATKVMGTYQYSFSYKPVFALVYIVVACVLVAPLRKVPVWSQKDPYRRDGSTGWVKTLLKRLACIALGVGTVVAINLSSVQTAIGVTVTGWAPSQYKADGFLLSFMDGIGRIGLSKPDSYSDERLENLEETYLAQQTATATSLPNIIVVMNESLADLEEFEDFAATEAVAPFMYSLRGKSNTLYGYVQVPVFGAGTSRTEFEFLTGANGRTFSSNVPYQSLVSRSIQALPTAMKKLGYITTALHPNASGNWSRDLAYPRMGFDTFISQTQMTHTDLVRSYISDASFFAEIEDVLAASDEPLFLFGVTMQDHGGYQIEGYEEPIQIVSPTGEYPKATQYINLVHESDSAFGDFIAYCETLTEPTVVLMFGDHFPSVESELLDTLKAGGTTVTDAEVLLLYNTPFYLWANFELDKDDLPEDGSLLSVSFLQTVLLDAAKLPKNGYQNFLTDLRDTYPVISASCVLDADGNVVSEPDSDLLADYDTLQYALLKGLGSFAS